MSFSEQDYQASLDYLYSFVDYSLTRQLRYSPDKFNLDRMHVLMDLMGNPHQKYPVVHIAGTKGKGSTGSMVASVLISAGYRVGLYTSPHLQDFVERIQVNGKSITHESLTNLLTSLKPLISKVPEITTFEITTALGFQAFADAGVEIAVIEVGLGGRLDATNVVNPLVSVITSLSYDHMNILGNTIEQIAAEKAGIIKPGKPVVLAPQWPEAEGVIQKIALERNAPLTSIKDKYDYRQSSHNLDGQTFKIKDKKPTTGDMEYSIPLLGYHQIENASTALAVVEILQKSGFNITHSQIWEGLKNVKWPGRFEILQKRPLIIIDSAHNQDSAMKLAKTIEEYSNGKKVILLFGASEDKDVKGMFDHLLPKVNLVIATQSEHPRAMDPNLLIELAQQFGIEAIRTTSIEEGVNTAIESAGKDSMIIVTGSIFIAAAARQIILNQK